MKAPPPQQNLQRAAELAFQGLARQSAEQVQWLGAACEDSLWCLPVLGGNFHIDLVARQVTTSDGRPVGPSWRILTLHYLAIAARPEPCEPEITFAELLTARSYADVYHRRVIGRLCATAGRDASRLRPAAEALGGRAVPGGDLAFQFAMFPRLAVQLVWYASDDEFPPSATLLLPRNAESYLCPEDLVVLSECLVARLGGRPF